MAGNFEQFLEKIKILAIHDGHNATAAFLNNGKGLSMVSVEKFYRKCYGKFIYIRISACSLVRFLVSFSFIYDSICNKSRNKQLVRG